MRRLRAWPFFGQARRLVLLIGAGLVAAPSCSSVGASSGGVPYLDDASYRRAELVSSLVNPQNGYSRLRLSHYATGDENDWDSLPEWNPAVLPIGAGDLDARGGATLELSEAARPIALPASIASEDDPALVALGELAFRAYPAQAASYFEGALASRSAATNAGLWVDDVRGVGGLVRARMADGSVELAMTCSTCHASPGAPGIVDGMPNARLDVGAALIGSGIVDPSTVPAVQAWGPGRLDVTTTAGTEPARIPDLRPVRWLTHLHQDATLAAHDKTVLAIRIETLLITSRALVVRPPRVIALALAAYVSSLASALPAEADAAAASPRGAQVFAGTCSGCHVPPSFTGPPVPISVVGTDPTLGLSASRGTGSYRVPSLHGVGSRGPLLHDGTVPSVAALFDPSRPTPSFSSRLHGAGAVEGHPFGLDLPSADRAALVAYLGSL